MGADSERWKTEAERGKLICVLMYRYGDCRIAERVARFNRKK
jgi:hypothetical protein